MSVEEQSQVLAGMAKNNFIKSCKKSKATLETYIYAIHIFMDFLKIGHEDYDKLLETGNNNPKLIQMQICQYIEELEKNHSPATISCYIAAIQKFYTMNDVMLNWKKIKSFMPEHEKVVEDRPYSRSEIKQLIDHASLRNKALILVMCSGGIRVGAIPSLRYRDLIPIDKYGIYKIIVYPKSKKSKYFTFCTPECRTAIDSYLEHRKRFGERIKSDSPVFRTDYNAHGEPLRPGKPCSRLAVARSMDRMLKDVGMRSPSPELENHRFKRSEIMRCHGMRKFFETNAFKAGMEHIYIRRLMGQKSGLEDSYLKLSEQELLEGDSRHMGFVGIIDLLTIDESHRLKEEIKTLQIEKRKMDVLEQRMLKYEKMLAEAKEH